MKRILALIISFLLVFSMSGCGNEALDDEVKVSDEEFEAIVDESSESTENITEEAAEIAEEGEESAEAEVEAEVVIPEDAPVVYMTTDISPEGLMAVYEALGGELTGENIGVKITTGEPPTSNYLEPELIKDLVQHVDGALVECNTAYGGRRTSTQMHYQVAAAHGYTEIADVVIMDEEGTITIPVEGGTRLTENYVGAHFPEYDGFLVLSHFKGHAMAGFGGALKNISIGMASPEGKCVIHTAGESHTSPWGGVQDHFLEFHAYEGLSHGFGLGTGTIAEGWLDQAVEFWEAQME